MTATLQENLQPLSSSLPLGPALPGERISPSAIDPEVEITMTGFGPWEDLVMDTRRRCWQFASEIGEVDRIHVRYSADMVLGWDDTFTVSVEVIQNTKCDTYFGIASDPFMALEAAVQSILLEEAS